MEGKRNYVVKHIGEDVYQSGSKQCAARFARAYHGTCSLIVRGPYVAGELAFKALNDKRLTWRS